MTRKRTSGTSSTRRRQTARMPMWAVVAFVLIALVVAVNRSTGWEPFGSPALETAPATQQVAVSNPTPVVPAAVEGTTNADSAPGEEVGGPSIPAGAERVRVVRIIDGDTIEVAFNGQRRRVRYIGIDTPEREQPGYVAATNANRAWVEDRDVYLVRDQSDTDVFDRLLRYIYLEDGTHVNAALIADGWAQPVEYPPDTRHAQEFRALAVEAAQAERGFWSGTSPDDGAMPYGLSLEEVVIRRGPGSQFGTNTTVPPGTPLSVFGRTPTGDWLQVRPPSRAGGWVPAATVDVRVPIAEIPLAEE